MRFGRLSCIEEIADTIVLPILDSDKIDLISQAGELLIPYMERIALLDVVWIRQHDEQISAAVVYLDQRIADDAEGHACHTPLCIQRVLGVGADDNKLQGHSP